MKKQTVKFVLAMITALVLLSACGETEPEMAVRTSHNSHDNDDEADDRDEDQVAEDEEAIEEQETSDETTIDGVELGADFWADGADNGYEYEYEPEAGTWQEAYYNKLVEIKADRDGTYNSDDMFAMDDAYPYGYALCDITLDGIPELIIKRGSCEADYNDEVFSYEDGELSQLGNLWSGHSSFYALPDGGMVQYSGHMGYGCMMEVVYEEGELVLNDILEESGYDDDGNWDEDFEYTEVSEYFPGARYVGYEQIDNFLYLAGFDGTIPKYSYSDDVADAVSAEDYYNSVMANNEIVYAVGDGYMNNVGAIEFEELLKDGVMYPYTGGDMEVKEHLVADVDGNGSYEYVAYFGSKDSDGYEYAGILSQENGTVYCYLVFSLLSTELTDDGYFIAYNDYKTRPTFFKNQIIWENLFK